MKFESQLAENVFKSKYLLNDETSPDEAIERIVKAVSKVFPEIEDEARDYINKQWFVPAGGIWRASGNPNKNVSHINCTTLTPPEDNLESIFNSLYKWAKYAAFGQGEGVDISNLRPSGSIVHNSSRTSTGSVSFMKLYDAVLKIIAQQGRRGASLISIIDHHPDIEEFIKIKDRPESDLSRIDTANLSIHATDEFMDAVINDKDWKLYYNNKYQTIEKTLKARDLFNQICEMARKKGDPGLQFIDTARKYSNSDALGIPIVSTNACFGENERLLTRDGYKTFKSLEDKMVGIFSDDGRFYSGKVFCSGEKEVIQLIFNNGNSIIVTPDQEIKTFSGAKEAKDCLNETLFYYDFEHINFMNTQKTVVVKEIKNLGVQKIYDFSLPENHWGFVNNIIVHNCSEQWLDEENVCNLSHINLAKFDEYGEEGFIKLIKFGIKFLNAIRINEYNENRSPTELQHNKIKDVPRVGLGITGFADYLINKKIVYGSSQSIEEIKYITSTMAKYALTTSYELAKKYGSFESYNKEKFKNSGYIKRLLNEGIITDDILDYQFNVALLTIAPTGSASIISNVGGSGVEPLYSRYMVRRERSTGKDWKEWFIFNAYVERYLKEHNLEVTKENADKLTEPYWAMSFDINPLDKVKLIAEAQKYIDSSISVTFNLPEEATVEEVKNIYIEAWKQELKGITVYREGSLSGVLITEKNYNKQKEEKVEEENNYKKSIDYIERPEVLPCDIYETTYKGHKFLVLVGLKDEKPFEIFVSSNENDLLGGNKYDHGFIEKVKSGHYTLKIENGETKVIIGNIGKKFDSVYASLCRLVSISLRYNVPIPKILEQLNKESTFADFEKVITKILKKYIPDNTKYDKVCPNCGKNSLIYIDGCVTCQECGYSRCE